MKQKRLIALLLIGWTVGGYAQQIRETQTNAFAPTRSSYGTPAGSARRIGVQSLFCGAYRDSLVRYFDRIEAYPADRDTLAHRHYRAIFGRDTLCFKERKSEFVRPFGDRRLLEVESRVAPHQRFEAEIDGLEADEIEALKRTMRQMKTADKLLNNAQTCIFYALQLLLDAAGIDPSPVITRNTTFTEGRQLNALFDHLLIRQGSYPCRYRALRNAELPERCVLVFRNARNEYIHAAFYRKTGKGGEFHSKNGLRPPVVLTDIRPLTEQYGRYDTPRSDLSEAGLDGLADSVIVYVPAEP